MNVAIVDGKEIRGVYPIEYFFPTEPEVPFESQRVHGTQNPSE